MCVAIISTYKQTLIQQKAFIMSNEIETFSFNHTMPVLADKARIEIREFAETLSEKSLYGAGTTRYRSTVKVYFIDQFNEDHLVISLMPNNKQDIIVLGENPLTTKENVEKIILKYVTHALMGGIYPDEEEDC